MVREGSTPSLPTTRIEIEASASIATVGVPYGKEEPPPLATE